MPVLEGEKGLFVDILGISTLIRNNGGLVDALITELADDLYNIGNKYFNDEYNRLFIYQLGDGFLVQFDDTFLYPSQGKALDHVIHMSIALFQHFLWKHGLLRIGISVGDNYGISHKYEVRQSENFHRARFSSLGKIERCKEKQAKTGPAKKIKIYGSYIRN